MNRTHHRRTIVFVGLLGMAPTSGLAQWTCTRLDPAAAISSCGLDTDGTHVVGFVNLGDGLGNRAWLWDLASVTGASLSPSGSTESFAYGTDSGQQVGYVRVNNVDHASLWTGSATTWIDLNPPVAFAARALCIGSGKQGGYVEVPSIGTRASIWSGSAASWVDITPQGANSAQVLCIDDGQQVGEVTRGSCIFASLWNGNAESWVNLHPTSQSDFSSAYGIGDGEQVGVVVFRNGEHHAALWRGTPQSWIDLHAGTGSQALGACDGYQVGFAVIGNTRASLWTGTAASRVDLPHPTCLPETAAMRVWVDVSTGTVYVAGYGWDPSTGRQEALLWTRRNEPVCAADFNADGFVNGDDFDFFAGAFEAGDGVADLNHDCFVNGNDFDLLAEHFEAGC